MDEVDINTRIEEMRLELELQQMTYMQSPEYRRERLKDRLSNIGSVVMFALIVGFFIAVAIDGEIVKKRTYLEDSVYETAVSKNDCYICGENPQSPLNQYWGQANLGLVNLNTMECMVLDINRYDETGTWMQTSERYSHHRGRFGDKDIGSTVTYSLYRNRGYLTCTINLGEHSTLNDENIKQYFCTDCCTAVINQYRYDEPHWDIALVSFEKKELYVLEDTESFRPLWADYHIEFDYRKEYDNLDLKAFYTPVRFTELDYDENATVLEQIDSWCQKNDFVFDPTEEVMEFIGRYESIHSISYTENYVEFQEWVDTYKSLHIMSDGSFEIYEH